MPEKPTELPGGDDGPAADRWNALAVASPPLLVQGLGSECTDLQGLRNFAVNGPDVIAALDEDRPGRVAWDWGSFDPSAPARSPVGAHAPA